MKSPLCEVCVKNEDILCSGCQRKLDIGEITHTEVEISRILFSLKNKYSSIEAGGFVDAKDIGNTVLIIVPKGAAGKMIGKGGVVIKELEKVLDKRVKIVEEGSLEEVAKELLGSAQLVGVNKVYGAKGEHYRVRVRRSRVPLRKEEIEKILAVVTGKKAELVLE